MGGKTGARKSNFFRVMTTRSGISFGCRGVSGQETTSAVRHCLASFLRTEAMTPPIQGSGRCI